MRGSRQANQNILPSQQEQRQASNHGLNEMVSGYLSGQTVTVDEREFVLRPAFKSTGLYFCSLHKPSDSAAVNTVEMEDLVKKHLHCDHQAERAKNNFTNFPIRPIECNQCETALFAENRKAGLT
jgi:hypothetical protein